MIANIESAKVTGVDLSWGIKAVKKMKGETHKLDAYPNLKNRYQPGDGNTAVFYLKKAAATISSFTEKPKTIKF